ncbi:MULTISPECIES: hypothetical protein [Streptomyces]|uniref:hypothetical protein n=1 Tax=Streptomyces TaxID=1883 RepID=UPI001D13D433|nr:MULTISPECIES: hypothetical protein [Streptomyces]MCC3654967.1 hypothetical protein [Streptomyces sp. S07_1.15]WSQ70703.1 hypothetical protein OG463_04120 [Streptomyces xinghaiensis]
MQTLSDRQRSTRGTVWPLLAGAAAGIGGLGAVLALTGSASPLRAPFTLFFLLAAPAAAIAAVLTGPDPLSRWVIAVAGAIAVDVLVAQSMLALRLWSARGGIAVVAGLSAVLFLYATLRRRREHTAAGSRIL